MRIEKIKHTDFVLVLLVQTFLLVLTPFFRSLRGSPLGEGTETYRLLALLGMEYTFITVGLATILAALTLYLAYLFIQDLPVALEVKLYTLLIAASSAPFLHAFVGLSLYQITLPLLIALLLCYQHKHWLALVAHTALVIVQPSVGAVAAILGLVHAYKQKQKVHSFVLFALIVIGAVTVRAPFVLEIDSLFTFFGGNYGYPLHIIILGYYSFMLHKYKPYQQIITVALLALSLFHEPTRFFMVILGSFYAGHGLHTLLTRKWTLSVVGQLTPILFVCVALFSGVVAIKEQVDAPPFAIHESVVEALQGHVVLTDPEYSEYFVWNGIEVASQNTFDELYSARTLLRAQPILDNNQIDRILIDDRMRQHIWQGSTEGLIFLVENDPSFSLVYRDGGLSLYAYEVSLP